MEIKLSQMQVSLDMELLQLKRLLIAHKKEGTVFFEEEATHLNRMQYFHLYFYLRPGTKTSINAFPIPIKDFQMYKSRKDQYSFMRFYFENYYQVNEIDLTHFEHYDFKRPYVGRRFIWYYKVQPSIENEMAIGFE
ncbi:hypothetical protein [Peribacillus deserti]|uniref:Uncharacterized protein n=1 Tax=Peribacillus deserti TaxID=673318 RepID=A0A2N5M1H3_9BACI|nr:hypothetical protein [Peribacillus deserti]PLT28199.1 hypothetical protein CUU66_19850 [Peribacillus deserti]